MPFSNLKVIIITVPVLWVICAPVVTLHRLLFCSGGLLYMTLNLKLRRREVQIDSNHIWVSVYYGTLNNLHPCILSLFSRIHLSYIIEMDRDILPSPSWQREEKKTLWGGEGHSSQL